MDLVQCTRTHFFRNNLSFNECIKQSTTSKVAITLKTTTKLPTDLQQQLASENSKASISNASQTENLNSLLSCCNFGNVKLTSWRNSSYKRQRCVIGQHCLDKTLTSITIGLARSAWTQFYQKWFMHSYSWYFISGRHTMFICIGNISLRMTVVCIV